MNRDMNVKNIKTITVAGEFVLTVDKPDDIETEDQLDDFVDELFSGDELTQGDFYRSYVNYTYNDGSKRED